MKDDRPYRLSIRVSDDEMDKLSKLKHELGYYENTALFLVKLALDMYDIEVEDQWQMSQNKAQALFTK